MVPVITRGDDVVPLVELVQSADGQDGFQVSITGSLTADADFEKLSEEDLQKGELFIGLPAALIILVLVFGAVVAGLVPVLLGLLSIVIAVALTALVGQAFEVSFFVVNMISAMGLALGIDYALFILSRFREERGRGLEKIDAIVASGATASRAVLFSGMAFVLAMCGMLLVPDTILRSLALGAILVGIVSVVAALTLLPAVLSLLGDRVNALRVPVIGRRAINSAGSESPFWSRLVGGVMRRPLLSLVAATALLLALALPVLSINTGFSGLSTLPDRFPSKQGFDALNRDFPGTGVDPAQIVVQGDVGSAPVRTAIAELTRSLDDEDAFGRSTQATSGGGDAVLISVPVAGDADGTAATAAIRHLRADLIPQAFGDVETTVLVGGATAESVDYFDIVGSWLPIVFAFVLGLSFILLTIAFRSIVIPAVAIALNLLSVGAAYGLLVLVFQKGVGADLLGFQQVDTIEAWVPLFLFSVLFGLSMDYQVFLLSRIKERYTQTGDTTDAISFGVGSTARLITGAALIIIAVFSGFAAGDLVMFQQMGFGVAVALLDRRHHRPLRPRSGQHEAPRRLELVPPLLAQLAPGRPRRRTRSRGTARAASHHTAREPRPGAHRLGRSDADATQSVEQKGTHDLLVAHHHPAGDRGNAQPAARLGLAGGRPARLSDRRLIANLTVGAVDSVGPRDRRRLDRGRGRRLRAVARAEEVRAVALDRRHERRHGRRPCGRRGAC